MQRPVTSFNIPMDNRVNALLETVSEAFDGTPWYGDPLMQKLKQIAFEDVNLRVKYGAQSIAGLTQHLINWRIFMLKKLAGDAVFDIELNSEADWPTLEITSEAAWNDLLNDLQDTQDQLLKQLKKDTIALDAVTPGRSYSLEYLILGVVQHDIYHAGQIGALHAQIVRQKQQTT